MNVVNEIFDKNYICATIHDEMRGIREILTDFIAKPCIEAMPIYDVVRMDDCFINNTDNMVVIWYDGQYRVNGVAYDSVIDFVKGVKTIITNWE